MTHNTINNIEAKGISKRAVEIEKKVFIFWCKRRDNVVNIYQKRVQTSEDQKASQ